MSLARASRRGRGWVVSLGAQGSPWVIALGNGGTGPATHRLDLGGPAVLALQDLHAGGEHGDTAGVGSRGLS